ncbi:MAG: AmmeMemoRadiSam system protein B [Deltaproteobacteria bacterium]|nr:AmmeMemoRadiSam system protein B [Deltaproteobacteria bacterium]
MEDNFTAQVAGQFYAGDPDALGIQITQFINDARDDGADVVAQLADRDVVGVLSPHAGYVYSGPVAGYAYAALAAHAQQYTSVVVMALSHRRMSRTISLLDRDAYQTPLGALPIDGASVRRLAREYPGIFAADSNMFEQEHSLEVQLPFIQVALPDVKIIPMIVATPDEKLLAEAGAVLFDMFGAFKDVAFVISSDLSHFFPYDVAREYDTLSLSLLEKWEIDKWLPHASQTRKGMCGVKPVYAFASMFEQFDADVRSVTKLKYMNSGDTAGDKSQVVGYGALAFSVKKGLRSDRLQHGDFGPYTPELRRALMDMAKTSVRAAAMGDNRRLPVPDSEVLRQSGAAFVTLKKNGQLRGCIGHVIARVPLYQCVEEVARAAAIRDTRFAPVTPAELDTLSYEISILTRPEPIAAEDVVVGRDGLIITRGPYSGLLLPQVPVEWRWDREEFLSHTCRKAGLPMDCWQDDATRIEAFRAIVFGEDELE